MKRYKRFEEASFILDPMSASDKEDIITILKKDNIKFKGIGNGNLEIMLDRNSAKASILISHLYDKEINFDEK